VLILAVVCAAVGRVSGVGVSFCSYSVHFSLST
jgi:hypothetical protein